MTEQDIEKVVKTVRSHKHKKANEGGKLKKLFADYVKAKKPREP